jgi:DNA-directed RNA polymerase specialized sigma24 family protein
LKTEQSDRIERLLALLLMNSMKGTTTAERVKQLNLAGFTNVEIADLLDIKSAVVSQRLYEGRKKRKKVK